MWVFGHLGIGSKIADPLTKRLPFGWVLLGTILPDLIDKPLYYGFSWATGRYGADIGLISCTRTFGHTAIFVLGVTLFAWGLKSKATAALAIGIASHLVLDGFQDYWFLRLNGNEGESSALIAMLFPFYLPRFSAQPFPSALEHLKSLGRPFLLVSEAIGLLILARSIRDKRRRFKIAGRIGSTSKKSKAAR